MVKKTVEELTSLPELPDVTEQDNTFEGPELSDEAGNVENVDKYRGAVSSGGDIFDPALHTSPPKETKSGQWRKIGGRGKKQPTGPDGVPIAANGEYRAAATNTANLYASLNRAVMGPGAEPKKDEVVPLIDAWEAYYIQNGVTQVPPWAAVLLTSANYSYTVATRPAVLKRVSNALFKAAIALRLVKPKKEDDSDAHVNSGHDTQR